MTLTVAWVTWWPSIVPRSPIMPVVRVPPGLAWPAACAAGVGAVAAGGCRSGGRGRVGRTGSCCRCWRGRGGRRWSGRRCRGRPGGCGRWSRGRRRTAGRQHGDRRGRARSRSAMRRWITRSPARDIRFFTGPIVATPPPLSSPTNGGLPSARSGRPRSRQIWRVLARRDRRSVPPPRAGTVSG